MISFAMMIHHVGGMQLVKNSCVLHSHPLQVPEHFDGAVTTALSFGISVCAIHLVYSNKASCFTNSRTFCKMSKPQSVYQFSLFVSLMIFCSLCWNIKRKLLNKHTKPLAAKVFPRSYRPHLWGFCVCLFSRSSFLSSLTNVSSSTFCEGKLVSFPAAKDARCFF